jgi:hypothetical protein
MKINGQKVVASKLKLACYHLALNTLLILTTMPSLLKIPLKLNRQYVLKLPTKKTTVMKMRLTS